MLAGNSLETVAQTIVRQAERQGYVVPRDIRRELQQAGLAEEHWKEVVDLVRKSLNFRQGRYYHIRSLSPRLQQAQIQQQHIERAIRQRIRLSRDCQDERRRQERIDLVQPVTVQGEDGREFTLLSRDLSLTGIRLVGTRRLLGQKVRVSLPAEQECDPCTFLVRILWTCALGDDLFENGGTFLAIIS